MCFPRLDVGGPADEYIAIPEAYGFAVPLRHRFAKPRHAAFGYIIHVELAANINVRYEITHHASEDLHDVRRGHYVVLPYRGHVPAAHETFWPAVGGRPDRCIGVDLVVILLDRTFLIFRRQYREDGRDLVVTHPVPV